MLEFLRTRDLTLDDYLTLLRQVRGLELNAPSRLSATAVIGRDNWPSNLSQSETIIRAMTKEERQDPSRLDPSRIDEITTLTDSQPDELNQLIHHFCEIQEVVRSYNRSSLLTRLHMLIHDGSLIKRLGLLPVPYRAYKDGPKG